MPASEIRVGLLWHSLRSENLGVGALALSNLAIVAQAGQRAGVTIRPVVIGFGGPMNYAQPDLPCEEVLIGSSRELMPGSRLWKALGACDIVLDIGAGDSWADIYGAKRFIWQWWSKEMTLLQGRPLALSPQTIGPFDQVVTRQLARVTMQRSRVIFARDAESLAFVAGMGTSLPAFETVDVAFRLPFKPALRAREAGRIQFGFNISGLLHAGGYTQNDQFGSRNTYREMVEGIITRLLQHRNVDITLVPHVLAEAGSVEDDVGVSHDLAQRFPGVAVAPRFTSPIEAKSFISGLDILAGSRMHATIAAASAGIAVVPLAYSRKFRGVFNSIGYPVVGDCTTSSADELVAMTLDAVDRRIELAERARAGAQRAIARLGVYEDHLATLFSEIAARAPH
jgi:colanic acid/amylovoran biosynthesis protein